LLLAELVQFCEDRTRHHVFNLDLACALGVQEEKELSHRRDHVERIERLCQVLQLGEGWHELEDVVFQVLFLQVAVAIGVVKTDLDARLEQVYLSHDVVEEGNNLNAAALVPFKFQEGRRSEELPALCGQLR